MLFILDTPHPSVGDDFSLLCIRPGEAKLKIRDAVLQIQLLRRRSSIRNLPDSLSRIHPYFPPIK